MVTGPLHVHQENIQGPSFKIYNAARQASSWECAIDWNNLDHDKLPEHLQEFAWIVASGSAHVEQIGMLTAARLMMDCDDYLLRLNLARAVTDEARHTEAFARYAISIKGDSADCANAARPVEDELITQYSSDLFIYKFLVHSLLEAVAIEEFSMFEEIFSASRLSTIYKMVKIDEARHVAIGINYLAEQVKKDASLGDALTEYLSSRRDVIIPGMKFCEVLGGHLSLPAATIHQRFEARINNFMDQVLAPAKSASPSVDDAVCA